MTTLRFSAILFITQIAALFCSTEVWSKNSYYDQKFYENRKSIEDLFLGENDKKLLRELVDNFAPVYDCQEYERETNKRCSRHGQAYTTAASISALIAIGGGRAVL